MSETAVSLRAEALAEIVQAPPGLVRAPGAAPDAKEKAQWRTKSRLLPAQPTARAPIAAPQGLA
ncbi:MAG: hypothetical protein NZM94_07230 [Roseiflexus sp.]|nr:hypothetical protein [Roseiflexus sp.]